MADKKKLQKISAELKKASQMHAAQAKKIENISKGPSMINLAAAIGVGGKQKNINKDTAVGNVPPHSHDNSQNKNVMNSIGNITGNANQNSKLAEVGEKFFQGDQFANQYASRPPVDPAIPIPPQPDPISDPYGKMFSPFNNEDKKVKEVPRVKQKEVPKEPKPHKEKIQRDYGGYERVGVVRETPNKIDKPREMPRKVIPPTNMNDDPKKSDTLYLPNEYKKQAGKMIDETDYDDLSKKVKNYNRKLVEDLQDMGRIKLNEKGKPYVVNRKN
jgi:hypothetical protein